MKPQTQNDDVVPNKTIYLSIYLSIYQARKWKLRNIELIEEKKKETVSSQTQGQKTTHSIKVCMSSAESSVGIGWDPLTFFSQNIHIL